MRHVASLSFLLLFLCIGSNYAQPVPSVEWDSLSLIIDGHRVIPVMGEIHYSRIPTEEWSGEVKKMQDGGVTMIACYVFWNHIEEVEGLFDWSGQRSLRRFLEVCKQTNMPVILRVGPFCHGEARCGGIPDWVIRSGCKTRSEDTQFLSYVEKLYRQIFTQVQGLQWKDGGPVIAMQFDNEYRGRASYLLRLKQIANDIGFDLPFYTRTGWPELATPVPFGELVPLYGDYADGFWDRSTDEAVGEYYKAFNFKAFRTSAAIASEQLSYGADNSTNQSEYPYFTCELGGGMMTSYHRRIFAYPEDTYSMAIVKLGSGSNLLGYYMYHGGTNPRSTAWRVPGAVDPYIGDSCVYLNETQRALATNYNDLPAMTYDFQAPIGEFGQINPHYFMLRKLHLFMHDFAETLAPMTAHFPTPQNLQKGDDNGLRWSYRSLGDSAFVFVNNYERLQKLSAKTGIKFSVGNITFPSNSITIPAGAVCIFPVGVAGLKYATAQLVARSGNKIYLEQIPGIPAELAFVDGRTLSFAKARGTTKPVYTSRQGTEYYLIDSQSAEHLFYEGEEPYTDAVHYINVEWHKEQDVGRLRTISIGANKVAEAPLDCDFNQAAAYTINIPAERTAALLDIDYYGDCARLYDGSTLIADNFYNGRHFLMALWRLPDTTTHLTLRILPLQPDMPVYFPSEAHITTPTEHVNNIRILKNK